MPVKLVRDPNKVAIPGPLAEALVDPYYSEGLDEHFLTLPKDVQETWKDAHFSATTLPRSPRQRVLIHRHSHKVIMDPLTEFWKMFGHVVHSILEKHGKKLPGELIEKRIGRVFRDIPVELRTKSGGTVTEYRDVYVHAQLDRYTPNRAYTKGRVQDWKLTKAESQLYDDKFENHAQLNVIGYLARLEGMPVTDLENVYLFRNWDARMVREGSKYPEEQFKIVKVPIWSDEKCEKYIRDRAKVHLQAEALKDEELPHCTDAERWKGQPWYRIVKLDHKTGEPQQKAKAKADSMIEAQDKIDALVEEEQRKLIDANNKLAKPKDESEVLKKTPTFIIQERPAKAVRCGFCEIWQFCNQRQDELKLEEPDGDESPE
jgi:hypothetical protein